MQHPVCEAASNTAQYCFDGVRVAVIFLTHRMSGDRRSLGILVALTMGEDHGDDTAGGFRDADYFDRRRAGVRRARADD